MRGNLGTAIIVSIVHATAMIVSGGIVAFAVYEWLGLRFISKSWFNLDVVWALSLILVGAIGVSDAASASALSAIGWISGEGWCSALVLRAAAEADGSNGPTVIFVNSALADDIRCGPSFTCITNSPSDPIQRRPAALLDTRGSFGGQGDAALQDHPLRTAGRRPRTQGMSREAVPNLHQRIRV